MTILSPAGPIAYRKATFAAAQIKGPVYLRLATGGSPKVYKNDYEFKVGQGVTLREGNDITIISTGGIIYEVLQAVDELERAGISIRLINIHTIKPIDKEIILKAARETRAILTVEEHSIMGGLGSCIAEIVLENCHKSIQFKRMVLNNTFPSVYGTYTEMK